MVALLAAGVALGCDQSPPADAGPPDAGGPTAPRADYAGGLWDAPWPDERLRRADGTIDARPLATSTCIRSARSRRVRSIARARKNGR